ncbi:MAG TPA: cysteine hydrolase family protein [Rhodocyclaceae bacterium]|nr:cysteine hydrolase family protein [Rhodocyclaceae bacterium]
MTGQPATPARLSDSALVIVDAQNTYREGIMQLTGVEPALEQCATLLARARALKIPVLHIQHDAGPGTPYDVSAEIGAIADKVAPADGEPVVVKNYPNAFVGTDLDARLKDTGVKNLVVVGFMTHMCINSTARGAFNLGYTVAVPAAATPPPARAGRLGGERRKPAVGRVGGAGRPVRSGGAGRSSDRRLKRCAEASAHPTGTGWPADPAEDTRHLANRLGHRAHRIGTPSTPGRGHAHSSGAPIGDPFGCRPSHHHGWLTPTLRRSAPGFGPRRHFAARAPGW